MRAPTAALLLCLALWQLPAQAFVHGRTGGGQILRRSDFSNVRYSINDKTAAGLTNSSGVLTITADSDPIAAIQAAMDAWSKVDTAPIAFALPGRTAADTSIPDGESIISFVDTPANRSVLGDAVAATMLRFNGSGVLADTDILFSPTLPFSTTLQNGTFDIQSVATHELGHALGADHSGLLGATMFFAVRRASNALTALTADDVAFLTDTYPQASALNLLGSISGTVTLSSGTPALGAMVTAIDPSTNIAVGAVTAVTGATGTYTIAKVPPGRYFVYVEPMDGPVFPNQFSGLSNRANVDFSTVFLGGAENPQALVVSAGGSVTADLTVEPGTPLLNLQGAGFAAVGGALTSTSGPVTARSGQRMDFAVFGRGLDDPTISADTISFLSAPITIEKGTFRRTTTTNNQPALVFTIQVAATAPPGLATFLVRASNAIAVYSGGIKILGPAPFFAAAGVVNAASFLGGPVAPGEIVSIFGTGLGPPIGAIGSLDPANGRLTATLATTTVTFNGVRAPLFFVRQDQINAQVPYEVENQSFADVVVSYQGAASAPVRVVVALARPGVFVVPGTSQGIVLNLDGTLSNAANPAPRGSTVIVFATGQGAIRPALATGELAPLSGALSSAVQSVTATIGGRSALVVFAGMTPNFTGLLQVNVQVPADAPQGNSVPLVLNVGGVESQANVTLAVR